MTHTTALPKLAAPDVCMGCGGCYAACPRGAVTMRHDAKGFYRSDIDPALCIGCGACARTCPVVGGEPVRRDPAAVLAAWDLDPVRRKVATSGGVFLLLADSVLSRGGWICGAVLDEEMAVRHIVSRERAVVESMRGSKYVQSDAGPAMRECLRHLRNGDEVLFTGVSCQVDAMRRLAGTKYRDRLLLVDVLCHGAPSPRFWRAYLDWWEACEGEKVVGARFRKKSPSWTVYSLELQFKAEHRVARCTVEDLYLRAFLGDYINQEACHSCPYVGTGRVGDVTLADFWGYVSETREDRNTEEGISLVLVGTKRGRSALDAALACAHVVEKPLSEAMKGNGPLRAPFAANPREGEFWAAFEEGGIDAVKDEYLGRVESSLRHRVSLAFNDRAYLLPRAVREALVGLRNRV